jgi:hypothetical protein
LAFSTSALCFFFISALFDVEATAYLGCGFGGGLSTKGAADAPESYA